jgi:predicted RNA-binding protein (virulence factor B family)
MIKIPSQTVKIGRMNRLRVVGELDFGLYLDGKKYGEILLPRKYVPEGLKVDDFIDVFLYVDSEDRPVATTETPYAMDGQLAYLRAVSITSIGAFLDWGLMKDLMVPFREQRERMTDGKSYIVYVYFDSTSDRMVASTKVGKYIDPKDAKYAVGDEVDLIVCNPFDRGYNVIIDRKFVGVIYRNEIFQEIHDGQELRGYIKLVRPDGKIDVELQRSGTEKREVLEDLILDELSGAGGFLPLTDKTPPEEIYDKYHASKRAFKRAIGGLYKKRLIAIEDQGIRLV